MRGAGAGLGCAGLSTWLKELSVLTYLLEVIYCLREGEMGVVWLEGGGGEINDG